MVGPRTRRVAAITALTALLTLTGCGAIPHGHRFQITTIGMQPTLQPKDSIETRPPNNPQRGDVIVYRSTHTTTGKPENFISRIIGLPGERIATDADQHVDIDDQPLAEPYLDASVHTDGLTATTVAAGHYYLLSDNRTHAGDSRFVGTITSKDIVAIATKIVFPVRRSGPIPGIPSGR